MSHPTIVPGFQGSLQELAHAVAEMRYDAVAEFLGHLEAEFEAQQRGDARRGYLQLSCTLGVLKYSVQAAKDAADQAWKISKPHMGP